MLAYEQNRQRNSERKGGRKKQRRTHGQLASVRRDQFGLVGANRFSSPAKLEDAAAIERALQRGY